jgi:hypothetical protein
MIETIIGLATITSWIVGLWCYPRCLDYATECYEKMTDRPNNVAINETDARYVDTSDHSEEECSPYPTVLAGSYYRMGQGDSPLFSKPSNIPVAKLLKYN